MSETSWGEGRNSENGPVEARVGESVESVDRTLLDAAAYSLGSNELIQLAAFARGFSSTRFRRGLMVIEDRKSNRYCFWLSESEANSAAAGEIATHKGLARSLLAKHGVPIPPGYYIPANDREQAKIKALELGYPLVVKPVRGQKGRAVTTNIRSEAELEKALERGFSSSYGRQGIVLERWVPGNDYRFFTFRNKVVSVVRREPASVIGDGVSTLAELVEKANAERSANPYLSRYPLRIDSEIVGSLLRNNVIDEDTVLARGQRVRISSVANLSQGGTSHEVLDSTHPTLRQIAIEAIRAIPGLSYGGVDIILQDHRKSVRSQDVVVIEVNARPASVLHHFPAFGPSRDVAGMLIDRLVHDRYGAWLRRMIGRPSQALIRITGRVRGKSFIRWLSDRAEALTLDMQIVGHIGRSRGTVTHELLIGKNFSLLNIGRLVRPLFVGSESSRVQEVTLTPVEPRGLLGKVRSRL